MTGPTVLIVDDSLTVRMDLADAFREGGFRVSLAASATEARRHLSTETIDVVILDVVLAEEDGIELLREIRATPSPSPPFVLLLSTEAEVKDRIRGLETGADDYVGKPYDVGYVIARARNLLRGRQRGDNAAARTILVVDDSATFREALRGALEGAGYAVVTAPDGESGLSLAASLRPASIIVDSVMPGIDGGAVIRRIRLDAALRSTPCILLTASDDEGAELRALDAGADAFARKDDLEIVLARLAAVLRSASSASTVAESLLGPKRILAVDDSATYLNELASVLRGEGYDVVLARSGEEALDMLAAQRVDCLLLDLVMPGIDGIETCRRIKGSPLVCDIPLIMLTASEDRGAMIDALGAGADDFISKTSELSVLKARVRAQLRRKQFEDEHRGIRERLLRSEMQAAEERAARELFEIRARLADELQQRNDQLGEAYRELQTAQTQLVQSAKMASLGELVAGVAHEINNPLAFVISHLGTVKRGLGDLDPVVRPALGEPLIPRWEKVNTRVQEMTTGLDRIRELVVKLRTFSRLDEGERKVVSLRDCVDSLVTILGHRLKERIEVRLLFAEPDEVDCYPGLLTQAIMNLMANSIDAIDSTERDGIIEINTVVDGTDLVIRVTDTGTGIPEPLRHRVFDPFFTTKPVGQGTGLGLSITYSIVQKHGGSLVLLPRQEGGTEAVMRLPIAKRRSAAP